MKRVKIEIFITIAFVLLFGMNVPTIYPVKQTSIKILIKKIIHKPIVREIDEPASYLSENKNC